MPSTDVDELVPPPAGGRARELWLQHAAGLILFRDVRDYAREQMDSDLDPTAREAALKAIDDALYGVMMVADGVSGSLSGSDHRVRIAVSARLMQVSGEPVAALDLSEGDGMCMGYHGWLEDDFGSDPIVTK